MDRITDLTQQYRMGRPPTVTGPRTLFFAESQLATVNRRHFTGLVRAYQVNASRPNARNSYNPDSATSSEQS